MMQLYRSRLAEWLDQRTPRERILLAAALGLGLLGLGVTLIWQPLRQHRADLQAKIALYEAGFAALQNPNFSGQGAASAVLDNRPIPVILTDSAATAQVTIRRLEAEGAGARVVLEDAPFDRVILWLEILNREHGLNVREIEMTRKPAPGVVSTTFALER
ncbi:MAG: type II secretion system protein GspM [Cypionkella sp.]